MNQGGQGQQPQGNPQAQAAQLAAARAAQQQIPLYKPEQMRSIGLLTDDEKIKYERGLIQLWSLHDSKPAGSPENLDARKKLMDFGKMLQSKVQQRRQQLANQQQRVQQQQGQQAQQAQQQQPQQTQPNQNAQQHPVQQQPAHLAGPPQGGNLQQQQAAGQPATPNTNAPQGARPGGLQQPKIPDHIMQHVNQMNFQAPPNEQDKVKWASEMKLKYTRALLTMESSRANLARIDHMIKDRADKGNPLTPEELNNFNAKKEQLQKSYQEGHNFVERTRQQLGAINKANQQQNGGGQGPKPGPNHQQPPPATPRMQAPAQPGGGQAAGAGANPMQNSAATVNAAIEAAKNQQLAAARGLVGQQGQQSLPQSQIVPPSAQQPQVQHSPVPHQAPQAQAQPQQQQHQPQAPNQPQNQNQNQPMQQPHIKLEPGTHPNPNLPAPLNTALASAAAANGLPSAGTPTQMNSARSALQTPQTATPTTGQPRPLSHSAALSMANQRTGSIAMPGQQPQAGTPTQSTPGTGSGVIGAAQQPHPSQMPQHPGQQHGVQPGQQSLQSKLPIPKVLPEKATQVPTPVPTMGGIGSGRPTFSGGSGIGGGVMGQPALAKTPAYQLEGEGDRVLNKKKLDELVRQVCGGTAEGDEGSLLTPDVEESVLNLADSFVDNVLHSACRNAKERGSKVLEIRDIQLVLERTYNIRIPGYSSEELRTVRKIQPSAAWITKMSAVQAAKVMPGKGDL
ncbi:hypothetical protein CONLIGDRAFT_581350 [Coniochaeta ligniaria NRRL 30616]|uniref:Transcription initiation factor TFIID subunit 12 domain-containing protein n=1 Tax=Coniochaeta ligniaria NRRL 30616 TaxID=1408157 RepID=A0A1J7J9R3_9PEZI|nr:hypothetical protein CONLIGDRAFT_581350 [Coniochaeta ligniaria NRRL 30616]